MIYCNLSDGSRMENLEIKGRGSDIRDELSAIIAELIKTDEGKHLVRDAFAQGFDPEWEESPNDEIRQFPDPNRRKVMNTEITDSEAKLIIAMAIIMIPLVIDATIRLIVPWRSVLMVLTVTGIVLMIIASLLYYVTVQEVRRLNTMVRTSSDLWRS